MAPQILVILSAAKDLMAIAPGTLSIAAEAQ
jgi:hypothetical protein